MNLVVITDECERRMHKLCSLVEQHKIRRFRTRLEQNAFLGDAVGPITLREFRLDGKRVYFVVAGSVVGLVEISRKNNQQEVINDLRENHEAIVRWLRSLL